MIASLGDKIDLVLDGGPCRVGLESTVLDLTGAAPAILRPGAITAEEIAAVLGEPVTRADGDPTAPKSPGQLASHYAPGLPLRLNAQRAEPGEALLAFGTAPSQAALNLSPNGDLIEAAANLFAMLRALDDNTRYRAIAVMPIPEIGTSASPSTIACARAARRLLSELLIEPSLPAVATRFIPGVPTSQESARTHRSALVEKWIPCTRGACPPAARLRAVRGARRGMTNEGKMSAPG